MQRGQLMCVARNDAANETDMHGGVSFCRLALAVQACDARGGRNAVEGHVEQRGHTARGSGARCARKTFPVRAAWLIDVDMCVHESRHHDVVTCVDYFRVAER